MHPGSRLALSGCRGASYRPQGIIGEDRNFWFDWLTHTQSLTSRIKSRCKHFQVQVLFEGEDVLVPIESRLLGVRGSSRAREVLLIADGHPVVWARTVVPSRALRGPWFFLRGLGSKPLGARLFSDPLIERSQFVFLQGYHLQRKALVRTEHTVGAGPHPARCALLQRQSAPALLTEVLLPSLRDLEQA
jgi:chorismate--pyruvate lyase